MSSFIDAHKFRQILPMKVQQTSEASSKLPRFNHDKLIANQFILVTQPGKVNNENCELIDHINSNIGSITNDVTIQSQSTTRSEVTIITMVTYINRLGISVAQIIPLLHNSPVPLEIDKSKPKPIINCQVSSTWNKAIILLMTG